jgi:localization factor PodJL
LRIAAELGDAQSQVRLARYLDQGKHGLAKDPVDAYKWATIAASKGHAGAVHSARQIELFLSPAQLKAGKSAAESFLQNQQKNDH